MKYRSPVCMCTLWHPLPSVSTCNLHPRHHSNKANMFLRRTERTLCTHTSPTQRAIRYINLMFVWYGMVLYDVGVLTCIWFSPDISCSQELFYTFSFDKEYIDVLSSTSNQSYHHVRAKKAGNTLFQASFRGVYLVCVASNSNLVIKSYYICCNFLSLYLFSVQHHTRCNLSTCNAAIHRRTKYNTRRVRRLKASTLSAYLMLYQ